MKIEREFGLVPNRSNPEQYIRLVRWEGRWVPGYDDDGAYETYWTRPMVWEWSLLDKRDSTGVHKHWVPTDISSTRLQPPPWPKGVSGETESMRRQRICEIRAAIHIDPAKGLDRPAWMDAPVVADAAAHN